MKIWMEIYFQKAISLYLTKKRHKKLFFSVKNYIEPNLCKELNLQMVTCPLIVDKESGFNDMLDRDGSRTPVEFKCGLGLDKPIDAQISFKL